MSSANSHNLALYSDRGVDKGSPIWVGGILNFKGVNGLNVDAMSALERLLTGAEQAPEFGGWAPTIPRYTLRLVKSKL